MNEPILISDPKRLDKIIQEFQIYLNTELSEIDYCYGRCYKNETNGEFSPEVYIGKNEYMEVFPTDKKSHLFFDVEDNENVSFFPNSRDTQKTANINLIVSANLDKIYDFEHRADENLVETIEQKINSYYSIYNAVWNLNQIVKKTANVFSNFSYKIPDNLNDMQPYFVVAFKFEVIYSNLC
ncbi:MAG: hypothetical protein GY849_02380 [Deltaproteobacteria bacterium]|nr:hypothetical protein [Deltaproteobacteria bacterium]